MPCPRCLSARPRLLYTKPDREFPVSDEWRACRNPACGAIFRTHTELVYVLDSTADADAVRIIEAALDRLSEEGRRAVLRLLDPGKPSESRRNLPVAKSKKPA